ncbi:sensor histidine kinase [Flavonifractor sp. An306]|uniref:sensor histidine kinase n=1 Tax=Flavonifractor sp. An306 TaxID=1965629 RepID=UPI001748FDB2|nr:GHKL domain-containing protein [Flavonifractor sp. An306]
MIPITTFLTLLYAINHARSINPSAALIFLCSLLVVCGCAYYLMYLFFDRVQKENSARYEAQLSTLQVSALRSRMEAVRAAEDAIRTERHDLRHRLQAVAELVSRGDKDAALDFLDAAQKRLDERKEIRWCRPPVLDAVFSSYFDQAQNQGILVEANIALPDTLPANEGELAIVLANALENAIHANLELPPELREIRCKMVGGPGVMLEISNPYTGEISFDSSGLPVAQREGHGMGIQSISAFCRKNGAVCRFDRTDG